MGHDLSGLPKEESQLVSAPFSQKEGAELKKIGLIVNPISGMGGRVGLKGTDGADTLRKAILLGAAPNAPEKAEAVLRLLAHWQEKVEILTCAGAMGQAEAEKCGFTCQIVYTPQHDATTAADTIAAARLLKEANVDLLLVAGGDGTARNIFDAVGERFPVLGIPTGVKIHSGVFATSPGHAADVIDLYLGGKVQLDRGEVMDIDEAAFRLGRVSAKLYGYLSVPYKKGLLQSAKNSSKSERTSLEGIAETIAEQMAEQMAADTYYIIGPGSTTQAIADRLGFSKSLLGVDIVYQNRLVLPDANEEAILKTIGQEKAQIIVTPIGGQGFLFGRGNQQISPKVIRQVGAKNIVVVAAKSKLVGLQGSPLLVDTGTQEVDAMLCGYIRVLTGYNEQIVYKVDC